MSDLMHENVTRIRTAMRVGDTMQSEGSRMAEWVLSQEDVPYGVQMAALEMKSCIEDWTILRAGGALA